jgi:hypothetical protein
MNKLIVGKFLSDLVGTHDLSDFVTEVQNVSPTSPILYRGAVVCRKADGTMTLAGAEATGSDEVFGIVLDPVIDPSSGGATASVSRSGVYDVTQLLVDDSASLRDYADRLRERGIFLEKLEIMPTGGGSGGTGGTSWDGGATSWNGGSTKWDT